ncbi:MAG: hypothetical protein ABF289_17925 [Clostridiales bacterium]
MDTKISSDKIEVVLKNEELEEDVISLKEIIETIIKGKFKILLSILLCLSVGYGFVIHSRVELREVKSIISYNYDGIEEGNDPEGKKLDTSLIKTPVILNKVISNLNLENYGIDSEILRNSIKVVPIIPGDIQQKIDEIMETKKNSTSKDNEEEKEFKYYPKEFEVVLTVPSSSISKYKGEQILNETIKNYSNYFYMRYTNREILANIVQDINYDKYDYAEISDVINRQVILLNNFLLQKDEFRNDTKFRSKTTGMAFQDIVKSISVIDQVDINKMDSLINIYNLTKNKGKLIKLYEYKIQRLELSKDKKYDESAIASDMMNKFERKKNVLFSSDTESMESDEVTDEGDEQSYYSSLADKSLLAGVEAKNNLHDIDYYTSLIERLNNDTIPTSQKKKVEKEVITISKGINEKLEKWINISNDTVSEFYETNFDNSIIKRRTPSETYVSGPKENIVLGISLLAGLLIGLVITLLSEYLRKDENEGEVEKLVKVKKKLSTELV